MPVRSRFRGVLGVAVLTAALVAAACSSSSDDSASRKEGVPKISVREAAARQDALRADMRKLWVDHVTWTRLFIVSAAAGAADTDASAGRLLQNQVDIGDAIKPIYGDAAGSQLTALLRDHILTAADLLTAAKAGDATRLSTAKDRWYANADQVGGFLAQANPTNWSVRTCAT